MLMTFENKVQVVPKSDRVEITPEIFDLENQFGYFCKAGRCSYFTG